MNLNALTSRLGEWLRGNGPESDVVVSTRIRLARNLAGAPFTSGRTKLRAGETLLAYSDGITECQNEKGAEFGAEGVATAAQVCRGRSASSTLFSVLGAAEDFAGGQPREDDMALIVVCRAEQ